ncbi:TNNI3K [Mytilus edulis]|uniref:TNNI3K n=1 Tax=Mytilus edulis TaxID=6550 RepID=A0A8S3TIE2_MYTED|nr:TNNI3K [Mytilus edulis]
MLSSYNSEVGDKKQKQRRLEGDTKALIGADLREDTFVVTKVVSDGLLLLKQNGVLLITGHAGTGKSRTGRHVLHIFCTGDTLYKCIKLNTLSEWEGMVNSEDNVVVLLDDIFGETNCIYNREKDTPILDKVHAYVCKGNIKVIITIRDTVKRQCQELFDNHRLFKFDIIDLSSNKYKLNLNEKEMILTKYMQTVRKSEYIKSKGFVDCNGDLILKSAEVRIIIHENPVKGFPLVIYQFVHNDKYFYLGRKFFDSPTEAILEEVRAIRRKGEEHRKFMIQYAVMVYTAINENCINPDDSSCVLEITEIIDAIYGATMKLKKFHIADAVMELKASYLINIPNKRAYELHHPTLQESVIISFAQVDEENMNKIIPLISWSFFLKIVKPESYTEKDGEVVLRIPTNSYKLLADRLAEFYIAEYTYSFVSDLSNTEIFQQKYRLLLPCLLEALEKEDTKDKHTDNMIRSGETYRLDRYFENKKSKECFLAHLLNVVAKTDKLDTYDFILKTFNQIIKTSNNYYAKVYMKFALITSLYAICSIKDEHDVKSVKTTLDIVEENRIPVLLDQGVILTSIPTLASMSNVEDASKTCVFLTLCIWKAYEVFNIPVLEFLLSKYNQTPFYSSLFLKMVYRDEWMRKEVKYNRVFRKMPSLSCNPLKWLMERFPDQDLNDVDFILEIACKYLMFDTVEYLAARCKTVDTFSCVLSFWENNINEHGCSHLTRDPYNQELLSFLFEKVDFTSTELFSVVTLFLQNVRAPDHIMYENKPTTYRFLLDLDRRSIIEVEKLKILKYIVGKFGLDNLDINAACQQACDSSMFKIVKWFVQNIDMIMLDVYSTINSALKYAQPDILVCILEKIEIASLDKTKILKSVSKHYNAKCSTIISIIVSTIWNNRDKKEEFEIQEIVSIAYERKSFGLLMCICDTCNLYSSLDGNTLLMLACGNDRGRPPTFDIDYYDNDDYDYGDDYFDELLYKMYPEYGNIGMVTWILKHFKIDNLDIKLGVLRLLSVGWYDWQHSYRRESLCNLIVSLLEKYSNTISTEEIQVLMNKSLEHNYYVLVNWILENISNGSLDKQKILNKACANAEIKTIKILRKSFFALDMNQAMINACTSAVSVRYYEYHNELKDFKDVETFLSLLWNEIDQDSIDIDRLVSTVCKEKAVNNNVMTWILLNLPQERIPINAVLISCCHQRGISHLEYIFHTFDNKQLDIRQAFLHACGEVSATSSISKTFEYNNIILLDFLFQRLFDHHDKAVNLSFVLRELPETNKHNVILFFLEEGFCKNIDFKHLMNEACYHGHVKLVQWILENGDYEKLNILDAMFKVFDGIKHAGRTKKSTPFKTQCVMCLALIWHYAQGVDIL